ncbi:uncharacterized protein LOC117652555 isoform X2 [Thrips palmi]|uniref:Uncharacterized protein LOC117652555 isoform X2 n=1 Tax=Thrips palmi TaxID=161013 RepID=A0A6P9A6C0_THRPL|nr:uncharacterized protein LOC117652555 isoform X2 [Thrips palmi]
MERGAVSANSSAACPYPPSVLDFLPLRGVDASTVEESWPCEVRAYWVLDLQPFVAFVRFIYAYFTLPVVLIGMVLNVFALRVWSSRPMRGTSLAVYLRALSMSDMGALIFTYFLGYWRSHHPAFNTLFLNNETVCRMHKILVSMFPMTSQWLQTALTVERLLVVWRPLRARNPAYPQVAVRAARRTVAVVYITLILVALTKWHFSGFEQYSAFDYQRCEHNSHSSVVAVYVYVALSTYLPGTLIFVSNVMLFLRLRRSDSLRRSLFAGTAHDGAYYSSDAAARTLVLFSLLYLLLQLPLGVVETVELYWDVSLYRPPSSSGAKREAYIFWLCRKLQLKWSRSLLFWLFQLSFVLNFVVYLKSGGRFRVVAKDMAWQWLSCGLTPLRSAGRSAGRSLVWLPRCIGRWSSASSHAAAYAVPGEYGAAACCRVAPEMTTVSDHPDVTLSTTLATATAPMSASGSTGSFSSDSSGNQATPGGLSLCWRPVRSRMSRPRARTNSCPHRCALRRSSQRSPSPSSARYSPCQPCRRARIHTWTTFVRAHQGLLGLGRTARRTCTTTSLTPLTASSEVDTDVDSVFGSPLFAVHQRSQQQCQDLGQGTPPGRDCRDWASPPLHDLDSAAYVNPAFLQPLQDAGAYRSQDLLAVPQDPVGGSFCVDASPSPQDFLRDNPFLGCFSSSNSFSGPSLSLPHPVQHPVPLQDVQDAGLFRSERALHVADGLDTSTRTFRTSRRLERYLSEPHR